jgi:hypothetical protein
VGGLTIDTRSAGSDDNGAPNIEVYYSDDVPVSLIQLAVVEGICGYDTEGFAARDEPGRFQSQNVRTVPTTIALDADYEVRRWEEITHAEDILEVISAW